MAQSNTFILAGYETTANTLSFCMYNIARDPEVQRRLLQEVDQFGRDRRVTYQDLDKVRHKLLHRIHVHSLRHLALYLSRGLSTLQHCSTKYMPSPVACELHRHCMTSATVLPLPVGVRALEADQSVLRLCCLLAVPLH